MPRIYWTSLAATASATLWAVFLFLNRNSLGDREVSLVLLFILNLCVLIWIREKFY